VAQVATGDAFLTTGTPTALAHAAGAADRHDDLGPPLALAASDAAGMGAGLDVRLGGHRVDRAHLEAASLALRAELHLSPDDRSPETTPVA